MPRVGETDKFSAAGAKSEQLATLDLKREVLKLHI